MAAKPPPIDEWDPRFMRFAAGVVGLCIFQRVIVPAPKVPEPPHVPKRKVHLPVEETSPAPLSPPASPTEIAEPAEPAEPNEPTEPTGPASASIVTPLTPPAPAGTKPLGTTAGWRIFESEGAVMAASSTASFQLTPPGVAVGAVLIGDAELLVELPAAFGSDASTLYRIKLPTEEYQTGPELVPDTLSPAGTCTPPGSVVSWMTTMTTGSPLTVRGAVVRSGSSLFLALRSEEPARIGNPLWLATCKRLGLPEPPIDPLGPRLYSEWRLVGTLDNEAGQLEVQGFRDEVAWFMDHSTKTAVALSTDGSRTEISLR